MSLTSLIALGPTECYYSPLALEPDLAELVDIFVSDLPERLAEIRRYVGFDDWAEVRRLAHQLKGAGGSYGFPHLSAAAGAVEQVAKLASVESADYLVAASDALESLERACRTARSGQPR